MVGRGGGGRLVEGPEADPGIDVELILAPCNKEMSWALVNSYELAVEPENETVFRLRADPFRCNSTNRQNLPIQQTCIIF